LYVRVNCDHMICNVCVVILHRHSTRWQMHCTCCCGCHSTGSAEQIPTRLCRTMSPSVGGWQFWLQWHTVIDAPRTTSSHQLSAVHFVVSFCPEWTNVTLLMPWLYCRFAV